jgi:hypothetical protein
MGELVAIVLQIFETKSDNELVETLTDMDKLCLRKDPIDIRTDEKRLQCDVL